MPTNNSRATTPSTGADSSSRAGTQPADRPLGWAVGGLGVLTLDEILPAFAECRLSAPVALISDDREKARETAANQRVMALCQQKALGPIRTFASSNCQNVDAPNIRLEKALGGGPVQDVGIYSINAARYVTGEEPVEVVAFADQPADDPRFEEVPASVSFLLRFPSGVLAHCDCSFASTSSQRYRVHCQSGYIEMDPAFAYSGLALRIRDDQQENDDVAAVELPQINQFAAEMDHFADCILNDKKPRTPGAEGLADIRIIVAIEEAVRTGRAVRVGR